MVSALRSHAPSRRLSTATEGSVDSPPGVGAAVSSLSSNIGWTLSGNVVNSACQWGLLVALARMGSPGQVGQLALGLAVTGPLFVASQLNLRGVQVTDAREEFSFSDYLGLRWIGTILAVLITAGIALGFGHHIEIALIIMLVGLARAFDNLSDVYYGALQQQEHMARIGKSMMLKGVLALAGLWAAMRWTHNVAPAAAALAAVSAIIFLVYDRRGVSSRPNAPALVRVKAPAWTPRRYWSLFCLALPLTIVMVLVSLNLNLPRYFIEKYRGEADLGIFVALSYLVVAGNTVISACGQATAPRLAKLYAIGPQSRFWRMLLLLLALSLLCGLLGFGCIAIAGKQVLTMVYGVAYGQRAALLAGLMVAGTLLYAGQSLGYGMTSARIFRLQVPLMAAVTAATTGACVLLVPRLGLAGAVIAMGAGFAVQAAGSGAILLHRWLAPSK